MDIQELKRITVVGAGDMGHGIAEVALIAGFEVCLQDAAPDRIKRGVDNIRWSLEKLVSKGKVSAAQQRRIETELMHSCVDLGEAVAEADLVIEAISENLAAKKELFARLSSLVRPSTVLASNTSTFPISTIASVVSDPGRVLGMHHFNPVVLMNLVEVIRGKQTREATMRFGIEYVKHLGKTPVCVNTDTPGFIVNRMLGAGCILLHAILDQAVAGPEEVDALFRKEGAPMGPYEGMDYTGIDINHHMMEYLGQSVHPDFASGRVVRQKVASGDLGKKTGKGFFDWSSGRPAIDLTKATSRVAPLDIAVLHINEASRIIEIGVCAPADIDTAMVNGTGAREGPLALAKRVGAHEISSRLERLAHSYHKETFRPTELVKSGALGRL